MPASLRAFLARHPAVRDALWWAVPALVFGAVLRMLLTSYLPYAFWGSDSRSYFSFAHKLLTEGYVSLDEKRRFLYPILMVPIAALPGAPLRWLAVLQHAFGLATLLPLAYIVRKSFTCWRLWIVPVTGLFTGLPILLWYEHELLGENVFFSLLLWAFAGWVAWSGAARTPRAAALFWWFFVPFALFILTKPSGRFAWPGVAVALVLTGLWRSLQRRHWIALAALVPVTLAVGSPKQGAWLLYTAVFPLTQLETPRHADYKAQVRDLVEPLAANLDTYYLHDDEPFAFLESPDAHPGRPLWQALGRDQKLKSRIYTDLAVEAIKARPGAVLYFALQRAVESGNLSAFGMNRFTSAYVRERTEKQYERARTDERQSLRLAFDLPLRGELPPYSEFAPRLTPAPGSWAERFVCAWAESMGKWLNFSAMPDLPRDERSLARARPTLLGLWLALGAALSLLPRYRSTLGVWMILALGYVAGVFLVSQLNARYFGPVWPILLLLLAVPADALLRLVFRPPE